MQSIMPDTKFPLTILLSLLCLITTIAGSHKSHHESTPPPLDPNRDYCLEPETASQKRLLEVIEECSRGGSPQVPDGPDGSTTDECTAMSDCLAEEVVRISVDNMISCRKSSEDGGGATGFRPCSVAATAYVILEQIRRVLIEETIYRNCTQVRQLFDQILRKCGDEKGVGFVGRGLEEKRTVMEDMALQEILAKFLIGIGKKMQTYEAVREDIQELERTKHMKALAAMCLSFALPGLLGMCEAAHFRTGLILQILALFVIGIYQFSRYGGYWAFIGVGSCLLIMMVELALMILIKKRLMGPGEGEDGKKTE